MKHYCKYLVLLSLFWVAVGNVYAQVAETGRKVLPADLETPLKYGAERLGKRQDDDMRRFREHRLGQFIHWGLYSIPGGCWKGKRYTGAAEWLQQTAKVSTKDWMALMKKWNPAKFQPRQWALMAKNMGAKYVKITTKHHEGFCLWPSKYAKYTIEQTPYKKDILGELVQAYNEQGIDVHFYFSVMDWSDPDWRYELKTHEDSVAFLRFLDNTEKQILELAGRYPTVKDFWFDGTWDESVKKSGWWTARIERELKKKLPGVTVNSRLRADDYGKRHFDSNGHLMGDYESGYERRLPNPYSDLKVTKWDWEACMTIPENQWGYHQDWTLSYVKSPVEILENIVHAVSMGGNMAVNFGPKADGDFREEEKQIASWIGKWMKKNGEAVYGCDYAGLQKQEWGYYTRHDNDVYMVVFNLPISGLLRVALPKKSNLLNAEFLDGEKVKFVKVESGVFNVCLPQKQWNAPIVIKINL